MQDIVLISLPKETIRHLVEDALRKVLSEQTPPAESGFDEKPLTRKQAAAFLGVAPSTLDNYRREGLIFGERIGGTLRFKKGELLAALSSPITKQKSPQTGYRKQGCKY